MKTWHERYDKRDTTAVCGERRRGATVAREIRSGPADLARALPVPRHGGDLARDLGHAARRDVLCALGHVAAEDAACDGQRQRDDEPDHDQDDDRAEGQRRLAIVGAESEEERRFGFGLGLGLGFGLGLAWELYAIATVLRKQKVKRSGAGKSVAESTRLTAHLPSAQSLPNVFAETKPHVPAVHAYSRIAAVYIAPRLPG